MASITLTGIGSIESEPDGSTIIIFKTKYVGDYPLQLTSDCMSALISQLEHLFSPSSHSALNGTESNTKNDSIPESKSREVIADAQSIPPTSTPTTSDDNNVTIHVPKRWAVVPETKRHDVVLLMFDPKTPAQQGFALSPEAANQIATALNKNARTVSEKTLNTDTEL